MFFIFFIIFSITFFLSLFFTFSVKKVSLFLGLIDKPDKIRKIHQKRIPLLGGLAPFLTFFIVFLFLFVFNFLTTDFLKYFVFLFLGGFVLMLGGFLDDKYNLKPHYQLIFTILAILIVLYGGIRIKIITNPFGGVIFLATSVSLIMSFLWLFAITYTTKILDGLDGLVSGIAFLGAFNIFLFSTFSEFKEPDIALVAIVLSASFLGFLFFNFCPAKIFLGEGGSLFAGFILGGLAIVTGAKIAVTLMVFALPFIDLLAVIVRRVFLEKKSIFGGDRAHLHFLLVDRGWSPKKVVYLYWGLAASMGAISIFLPSIAKIAVLGAILIIFFLIDIFLCYNKNICPKI